MMKFIYTHLIALTLKDLHFSGLGNKCNTKSNWPL